MFMNYNSHGEEISSPQTDLYVQWKSYPNPRKFLLHLDKLISKYVWESTGQGS